jgi:hypothetical protein
MNRYDMALGKEVRDEPKACYLNGEIVDDDGSRRWYKDGLLHREDGPAVELPNGDKEWCQFGQYHRVDGPAVERQSGYEAWYQFGLLHRANGPAVTFADYSAQWYRLGVLHRLEGPAIDDINGKSEWYINGRRLTKEKHDEYREQMGVARAEPLCESWARIDRERGSSSDQN